MGSVVAMDLSNSGAEVGVGDIDAARAESIAKETGGAAFKVDIWRTEDLTGILRKYDAVVNASWYEFNLQVMKASFKARCNYNDLGGLFHTTRKQLALNKEAKRAGVSAIVGGGESPGITNVMASLCAQSLTTVDTVKIYAGSRERPKQKSHSDLAFPFSVSTVLDEYSKKPVEFLNGRFVELPALSGMERVKFPEPVGLNTVHYSIHSEPATLPFTLGAKNVEFKLAVSEAMANALRPLIELGFVSEEKIPINGSAISPKEFLVSFFNRTAGRSKSERSVCLRAVVSGFRGKRKASVKADLVSAPKGKLGQKNGTAFLTGISGSIFGQLLAGEKVQEKGVIAPESAVDPAAFISELERRKITVSKRIRFFDVSE
jgi:lysine 6-dehydrogenase